MVFPFQVFLFFHITEKLVLTPLKVNVAPYPRYAESQKVYTMIYSLFFGQV